MKAAPARIKFVGWFAVFLAIGTVIAAIAVIGSPQTVRARRLDAERCDDLATIRSVIEGNFRMNKRLPESLKDLTFEYRDVGVDKEPLDPTTNEHYGYKKTGEKTYQLSAAFQADSLKKIGDEGVGWQHPFTEHRKGSNTFELEVNPSTNN